MFGGSDSPESDLYGCRETGPYLENVSVTVQIVMDGNWTHVFSFLG